MGPSNEVVERFIRSVKPSFSLEPIDTYTHDIPQLGSFRRNGMVQRIGFVS